MSYKIIKNIRISIFNLTNKLSSSGLLARIFTKSNISKVIIIFVIGFVSRIFISYVYGVNVNFEYLHSISLIYYILMATFIVTIGEVISYFEFNIIPSSLINSYSVIISKIAYTLDLLNNISKIITLINNKIYYVVKVIYTKGIGYNLRDIKISYLLLFIKDVLNINKVKMIIDYDFNNVNANKSLNIKKELKIDNVVNKGSDKGDILLPKVYNPNGIIEELEESSNLDNIYVNKVISSNNPNKSNVTVAASEVGFPSDTVRRGDDILLVSPNRNVENSTNSSHYTTERGGVMKREDFNLYDSDGGSDFQTPATMSPLFNTYSIDPRLGYAGLVQTSTGLRPVSTTNSYHVRANDYPPSLVIRNKVANPSVL
jgi:hypothetical protein